MIGVGLEEGAKLVIGGAGAARQSSDRPLCAADDLLERPSRHEDCARGDLRPGAVDHSLRYVDEAIEIANDTVYGLGAHVQGTDIETVRTVAGQIRSGQVHLNYPDWDPNAPFGGYKRSGNGREYGLEGMEEYLETKAVLGFLPMKFISESDRPPHLA
jgi:aldehyde dehydrogenase (NAD+)